MCWSGKIFKKSRSKKQLKSTNSTEKTSKPPPQKQSPSKKTENCTEPQAVEAERAHSISTPELLDEGNHASVPKEVCTNFCFAM